MRLMRSLAGLGGDSDAYKGKDIALPSEGRRDPKLPPESKKVSVRAQFGKAAEGYKAIQKIGKPKSLSAARSASKK